MPSDAFKRESGVATYIPESLPSTNPFQPTLFQVWEFEIGPGFHSFFDPIKIFCTGVLPYPVSIRVNYTDLTVVEIDFVVLIHGTDVVGMMSISIT